MYELMKPFVAIGAWKISSWIAFRLACHKAHKVTTNLLKRSLLKDSCMQVMNSLGSEILDALISWSSSSRQRPSPPCHITFQECMPPGIIPPIEQTSF